MRTLNYYWFDPETLEFAGFHLVDGGYQPIEPNPQGWLWSQQLQLYLGIHSQKLRLFTNEGQLLPTLTEVVAEEQQQKELAQSTLEEEQQQKELAQQKAERLAAKLRDLGIDPDT